MKRSSILLQGGCILFGLLLPVLALEIVVRAGVFDPHPPRGHRPKSYYLPMHSGTDRDYRYDTVKPLNTFRIVVVGDSFTFGDFLQFDDTFSKRLERWFNLNGDTTKVEVINYSKDGYSSADELPLVRNALETLSPNLVLLEYTLNDPELKPYRANTKIVRGSVDADAPIYKIWRGLGFVMTRYYNWQSQKEFKQYYYDLFQKPETWNRCVHALSDMKQAADAHQVPFAAVIFPMFNTPLDASYSYEWIHKQVSDQFAKLGVPALDLLPTYRNIPNDWLEIIPGENGHPNEIAHRMAAEAIYNWLRSTKLVPRKLFARRVVRTRNIFDPTRINSGEKGSESSEREDVAEPEDAASNVVESGEVADGESNDVHSAHED